MVQSAELLCDAVARGGGVMILIHCCECRRVVGKAEKLYERLGMTVYCGKCVADMRKPTPSTLPEFLRGLAGRRR